jgi:hypothetical protein
VRVTPKEWDLVDLQLWPAPNLPLNVYTPPIHGYAALIALSHVFTYVRTMAEKG